MTLCVMMVLDPKSSMIEGDQRRGEVGEPMGSPRDQGMIRNIRESSPESLEGGGSWPGYKLPLVPYWDRQPAVGANSLQPN